MTCPRPRHARAKKRRGGWNVMWKRIPENFDDAVRRAGADLWMVAPLTGLANNRNGSNG
jgi:hypothetical protein